MTDPLEKVLIEPAAVARVLGCKPSTLRVRRWREPDSKPRWVKIGGRVMYPRKEVVSYLHDLGVDIPGEDAKEKRAD